MIIKSIRTQARVDLAIRTVTHKTFTGFFLTVLADGDQPTGEAAAAVFEELAHILAEKQIQPIQEKIYGIREVEQQVLDARRKAFVNHGLDPSLPTSYIEGRPAGDAQFNGVSVWGLVPVESGTNVVKSVGSETTMPARCWEGEGFRMLYLPYVEGNKNDGKMPSCATSQAQHMFTNVNHALEANDFHYSQVVRTWIYMSRLLDWYGEFNRVRTNHHDQVGLGHDNRTSIFPASTGIQGRHHDEECFMDVLAVDSYEPGSVGMTPICQTSRQGAAFTYGSGFSRGMGLDIEGRKTVFVSGTASINSAGQSIYWDNPEAQTIETLLNVAALLQDNGGGLKDITLATVFCKNNDVYEAYKSAMRLLQIPAFPCVEVITDVCRHELLIEIEAMAVI